MREDENTASPWFTCFLFLLTDISCLDFISSCLASHLVPLESYLVAIVQVPAVLGPLLASRIGGAVPCYHPWGMLYSWHSLPHPILNSNQVNVNIRHGLCGFSKPSASLQMLMKISWTFWEAANSFPSIIGMEKRSLQSHHTCCCSQLPSLTARPETPSVACKRLCQTNNVLAQRTSWAHLHRSRSHVLRREISL